MPKGTNTLETPNLHNGKASGNLKNPLSLRNGVPKKISGCDIGSGFATLLVINKQKKTVTNKICYNNAAREMMTHIQVFKHSCK